MAIHTLPCFGRTIKFFRLDELLLLLLFFIGMGFAARSPRSAIESMKLINKLPELLFVKA